MKTSLDTDPIAAITTFDVRSLERELLTRVATLLTKVSDSVARRLRELDERLAPEPPFAGYEEMTARAIIAEIGELDPEKCREILAFEADHKHRTTVLRAAESRLGSVG